MVLKGRITTSFGRIARTTSLVSTQSLSAAPRTKNWSRYRIFSIFFFWRILQKNPWCHRPGSVVKDTSDTVPRPRHRFFHSIYGSKSPNPEDNRARSKFWRISNCCSHVPRHVTQTGLRVYRNMWNQIIRGRSIFWPSWPNFWLEPEFIGPKGSSECVRSTVLSFWDSGPKYFGVYP